MCWSEEGDSKVFKKFNLHEVLERKWSSEKGYMSKWKLTQGLHI